MIRHIRTFSIFCILLASSFQITAQDSCEPAAIESTDLQNQEILFVVSTDTDQQIWKHNFLEGASVDTGIRIPVDAFQLDYNPRSNQLAYRLRDIARDGSDNTMLKIIILDIITGDENEVFSGTSPEIAQLVDLHWIDDTHVGFVSNGREQQYTIVDIEEGSSETYQAGIPIPPRDTIGEDVRGDWHIEFSPNFARAAFMNLRDYESSITFWDLASGQLIETNLKLPVGWIAVNRAFRWADADHFLIMNEDLNWLEISFPNNTLQQITNVGLMHRLRDPIVSPDTSAIVFQIHSVDLQNFNTSIGVRRDMEFIESCLNEESGQYHMNRNGWDVNSRYFAFTVYDYVDTETNVYVFDTEMAVLSNIYSMNYADPKAEVLGWIKVN